jgi:hypothetical protein
LQELEKTCNPTGLQLVATGPPVAVGAQTFIEQLQLLKICHFLQLVTTGHDRLQPVATGKCQCLSGTVFYFIQSIDIKLQYKDVVYKSIYPHPNVHKLALITARASPSQTHARALTLTSMHTLALTKTRALALPPNECMGVFTLPQTRTRGGHH